jgi:hypothetical protein
MSARVPSRISLKRISMGWLNRCDFAGEVLAQFLGHERGEFLLA